MIFVGIILAIITLLVEYWYFKYKKPLSKVNSAVGNKFAKQLQVKQATLNNTFTNTAKTDFGISRGDDSINEPNKW